MGEREHSREGLSHSGTRETEELDKPPQETQRAHRGSSPGGRDLAIMNERPVPLVQRGKSHEGPVPAQGQLSGKIPLPCEAGVHESKGR